jgi:hypothetical protein
MYPMQKTLACCRCRIEPIDDGDSVPWYKMLIRTSAQLLSQDAESSNDPICPLAIEEASDRKDK